MTRIPFMGDGLGAELAELFAELDQVKLFDGDRRWTVLPPGPEDLIAVRSRLWHWERQAVRAVDLHDGTFLARLPDDGEGACWVRMRADRLRTEINGVDAPGLAEAKRPVTVSSEDGATLPVVGQSLAEILKRALETGGGKDLPVKTSPS